MSVSLSNRPSQCYELRETRPVMAGGLPTCQQGYGPGSATADYGSNTGKPALLRWPQADGKSTMFGLLNEVMEGEANMGWRIKGFLFPGLCLSAISGMSRYYESVEQHLESASKSARAEITRGIQSLGLAPDDARGEMAVAFQEHAAKYDMLFANFLRYSFVALVHLVLVDWLGRLCRVVKNVRESCQPLPAARRGAIKEYRHWLAEQGVSVPEDLWQRVHDLTKVRNCIVHASGSLKRSDHSQYLRKLARRQPGLRVSNASHHNKQSPLYLEQDMLVLDALYCRRTVDDVRQLFEELCKAVPLNDLVVEMVDSGDSERGGSSTSQSPEHQMRE